MSKISNKELYSEIIKKVISKELTQKEAEIKLGISDRQVRRISIKYKNIGEDAFVHKNLKKMVSDVDRKQRKKEGEISGKTTEI